MCPVRYFTMIRSKNHVFDLRLHLVRYCYEQGIRAAARHFGCSRNTVRLWKRRYEAEGIGGFHNKSRAPRSCPHKTPTALEAQVIAQRKRTPGFGARRMKMEFELRPSVGAIARILRQNGLSRKPKNKQHKKRDLRAVKARYKAFRRFHMDVKYLNDIPHYWPQMTHLDLPRFQYSIRELRTGAAFVSYAKRLSVTHAELCVRRFLLHLRAHRVPLNEVVIQTDRGSEFDGDALRKHDRGFTHTIEKLFGATHRQLKRTNPNANADVESFHNLIEVEFFDIEQFPSKAVFWEKVATYQNYFNLTRKNSYKAWRSPRDILRRAAPRKDPRIFLLPPVDLDTLLPPGHSPDASDQVGQHVPVYPDIRSRQP